MDNKSCVFSEHEINNILQKVNLNFVEYHIYIGRCFEMLMNKLTLQLGNGIHYLHLTEYEEHKEFIVKDGLCTISSELREKFLIACITNSMLSMCNSKTLTDQLMLKVFYSTQIHDKLVSDKKEAQLQISTFLNDEHIDPKKLISLLDLCVHPVWFIILKKLAVAGFFYF